MIDLNLIRKNTQEAVELLALRGVEKSDVEKLLDLDIKWRKYTEEAENLRAQQNKANADIAKSSNENRQQLIDDMKDVAEKQKATTQEMTSLKEQRDNIWRSLPNIPMPDVPKGGEADFEVIRTVPTEIPNNDFPLKSYLELTEPAMIDLERGAKVSGSRFVYLKGDLARLQIALVSYAFDILSQEDFIPVIPPVLIGQEAMSGMGYLDKHEDEIYKTQDNLYLTGTSEQSIGSMHMNEILDVSKKPLRYVAYSSCFRREAGSHGKDVKGIMRMHQFEKIEMFSFTAPDQSNSEHDFLLSQQEKIMADLKLPYRVIKLASGDMGMPSAKTYDIESWIPSEGRYRETHSTSNTTDYQARRLNIRIRAKDKIAKAHLLNGTAMAIGRILIALIENHQQEDGSIHIPEALHQYLPFKVISKQGI